MDFRAMLMKRKKPNLRRSKQKVRKGEEFLNTTFALEHEQIYGSNKRTRECTFYQQNSLHDAKETTQDALNIAVSTCFASMYATVGIRKYGETQLR